MTEITSPKIYQRMCDVMAEISAVGKEGTNTAQGYKFRKADDIVDMLHPILSKHKIFILTKVLNESTREKQTKSGISLYRIITMEYTFVTDDGSSVVFSIVGEGMDSGDKAGNKALTACYKYGLCQVFCIPNNEFKDSENDSHELSSGSKSQGQNLDTVYDGSENMRKLVGFQMLCAKQGMTIDKEHLVVMNNYCKGAKLSTLPHVVKVTMALEDFKADVALLKAETKGPTFNEFE